jgi:signal transduction histidine kinase
MELILFRIIQEALNNIGKHASATRADVNLEFADSQLTVAIKDNGKGFDLPDTVGDLSNSGKLGLVGMNERVSLLGGTLVIQSKPGRGTTVDISVPLGIYNGLVGQR